MQDDLMRSYCAVEPSEEDKLEAQLGKEFKTYIQGVAEEQGIMLMKGTIYSLVPRLRGYTV